MPEPTFIIIGAPRCGTTSMARWLDAHPDVFVTRPKEVFFFSHQRNYDTGWDHYLELFDGTDNVMARGEATTDYSNVEMFPHSPERIARHIPDCRLIFMVRHPLDRIASQWKLARSHGSTILPLSSAIFELPQLIDASHYLKTMQVYLRYFSIDQFRIVMFEDFKADPKGQAEICLKHIGIEPGQLPEEVPRAPSGSVRLRHQPSAIRRLRKANLMPFYRAAVPNKLRRTIHLMITRKKNWRIQWDRSTLLYVRHALEDDTRCFLEMYCSKESTYWSFDTCSDYC